MIPESIFVTMVVVAVVQLIKFIRAKAWDQAVTIVSAAVVGAVAGAFGIDHLTIANGILVGLVASGLITTAKSLGGTN